MTVTAVIPTRYNSKRLPGKPLIYINGKTLIERTFESISKNKEIDEIIILTDDQRIFEHTKTFCKTIKSDKDYPNGTSRIASISEEIKSDLIINLQCDEPFMEKNIISKVISFSKNSNFNVVTPISKSYPSNDPNKVKCVINKNKEAIYFSRSQIPYTTDMNTKNTFIHIGVYCYKKDFLLEYQKLPNTPLQKFEKLEQLKIIEHGYKIGTVEVGSLPLSINTEEDLIIAKELTK